MGQLLATIQSGMKKISDKCLAAGTKLKAKIIKHKRKLRWIALILAVLILITTLILECYSFVDSLSQGIVINNTAGVLVAGNVYNQGNFVGLGSSYLTLPNTNMLINFDSSRENAYPSIIARVQQGILVTVSVNAKVTISTPNLLSFIEQYGLEIQTGQQQQQWEIYLQEKIRNTVVQQVATCTFYQLSTQLLKEKIDNVFIGYNLNIDLKYPWIIRVAGLAITYPNNSFAGNQTLGVKLLQKLFMLDQLQIQKNQIAQDIAIYGNQTDALIRRKANIDASIQNRKYANRLNNSQWIQGLQIINNSTGNNATRTQRFLELYFSNLYNITYRLQNIGEFKIV